MEEEGASERRRQRRLAESAKKEAMRRPRVRQARSRPKGGPGDAAAGGRPKTAGAGAADPGRVRNRWATAGRDGAVVGREGTAAAIRGGRRPAPAARRSPPSFRPGMSREEGLRREIEKLRGEAAAHRARSEALAAGTDPGAGADTEARLHSAESAGDAHAWVHEAASLGGEAPKSVFRRPLLREDGLSRPRAIERDAIAEWQW